MITITRIVTAVTVFLAISCILLFFESIYVALTNKERRSFLSIILLALMMTSIILIVEQIGLYTITVACW